MLLAPLLFVLPPFRCLLSIEYCSQTDASTHLILSRSLSALCIITCRLAASGQTATTRTLTRRTTKSPYRAAAAAAVAVAILRRRCRRRAAAAGRRRRERTTKAGTRCRTLHLLLYRTKQKSSLRYDGIIQNYCLRAALFFLLSTLN